MNLNLKKIRNNILSEALTSKSLTFFFKKFQLLDYNNLIIYSYLYGFKTNFN